MDHHQDTANDTTNGTKVEVTWHLVIYDNQKGKIGGLSNYMNYLVVEEKSLEDSRRKYHSIP